MERRTKLTAAAGAAALVAALLGWRSLGARGPDAPASAEAAPTPVAAKAPAPAAPRREARAEASREREPQAAPPHSLRGTEVDGALRVDELGDLILDPDIIRLFDYFLTATGEESPEALRARILAAIRERLDGPAALQATALLDKYLAYREASRRMPSGLKSDDLAARLEAIRRLRREHFGEEAASKLFGDEERESAVAIAQSRVAKDPSLTPEEREARLAELDEGLPEAAREAREEALRPLRQQADEEALRAAGATDEEMFEHRAATVGEDAAERLAALDKERADWKQRVDAFRVERERIASTTPDEGARRAVEQRRLDALFSPEEQLRVRVILKMPRP